MTFISDGPTRTQLKSDVIQRIRKQLIKFVTIQAKSTPDKTKIATIINELFFYTHASRGGVSIPVRTVQELADGMTAALAQNHWYVDLYIDTGRLPSNVSLCLDQHNDNSRMMTRSTMEIEFDSLMPNTTLNPAGNTMQTTFNDLDLPGSGNWLITRNGAILGLTPQGTYGAKQFLLNVPACSGTSTTAIRNWFNNVFSVHLLTMASLSSTIIFAFTSRPMRLLALLLVTIRILSSLIFPANSASVSRTVLGYDDLDCAC